MAGTYLPLIGGDRIISVSDTAPAAMNRATINGVQANGRKGTQKVSLLVALAGAATTGIPLTTAAALFSLVVQAPPLMPLPADAGLDGFDYSKLLPDVRAYAVCSAFVPTVNAWPVDMTALLAAMATAPANIPSVVGRLTGMNVPSTDYPYGSLIYSFTGAQSTAAVANALIAVTIDFGASPAN